MRILQINSPLDIRRMMKDIKVDACGINIMLPKAVAYLIRMNSLSNITANILKQEMLSLGGDAAVARGTLTGQARKTDCLLIGSLAQFNNLNRKLKRQPFGLSKLSGEIACGLENYRKDSFTVSLGRYGLKLASRTNIMGILNLTPDSFSGDGFYQSPACPERSRRVASHQLPVIMRFAEKMVREGADIIDAGGESSRPGARPVSIKEELQRVIPVIKLLSAKIKVPLSVDTYKPEVAEQALDNGAAIVNDITGLKDKRMAKLIARHKAGVVIMHMKGNPRTMQKNPVYASLIDEIAGYLDSAIMRAKEAGIDENKIIIDPGIGFGKTLEQNLTILNRLSEFKALGMPILVGPSRKSFIGKILNAPEQGRVFGTVSACVLAAKNGAKIVRVHDVKAVKEALKVTDSVDKI